MTEKIYSENVADDDPEPGSSIFDELNGAGYEILHFAAHGVRQTSISTSADHRQACDCAQRKRCCDCGDKYEKALEAGMVIGPDLYLTASHIRKMRSVPRLVFLNCCHLGYVSDEEKTLRVSYGEIAANLATEFINMGVEVVVAAGWAVADHAAQQFAQVFYQRLLADVTLADAIHAARESTYNSAPEVNTFGAYQCWGDPEFKFKSVSHFAPAADRHKHHSLHECMLEAMNIRNAARGSGSDNSGRMQRLREFTKRLRDHLYPPHLTEPERDALHVKIGQSRDRARAIAELGRAFGEMGDLKPATYFLNLVARLNPTALSNRQLQQLGNFECRYAVTLTENASASVQSQAQSYLDRGRKRLEAQLHLLQPTVCTASHIELYCMLGSAWKRQLLLHTKKAQIDAALDEMHEYYGLGWAGGTRTTAAGRSSTVGLIELAKDNRQKPDLYAFPNFLLAAIAKAWYPDSGQVSNPQLLKKLNQLVQQLQNEYHADTRQDTEFWIAVGLTDIKLLSCLHPKVGIATETLATVAEDYRRLRQCFGSSRQWASVVDQVKLIRFLLSFVYQTHGREELYQQVIKLEAQIREYL